MASTAHGASDFGLFGKASFFICCLRIAYAGERNKPHHKPKLFVDFQPLCHSQSKFRPKINNEHANQLVKYFIKTWHIRFQIQCTTGILAILQQYIEPYRYHPPVHPITCRQALSDVFFHTPMLPRFSLTLP